MVGFVKPSKRGYFDHKQGAFWVMVWTEAGIPEGSDPLRPISSYNGPSFLGAQPVGNAAPYMAVGQVVNLGLAVTFAALIAWAIRRVFAHAARGALASGQQVIGVEF